MLIKISNSFIRYTKLYRNNDWNESVSDLDIHKKIYNLLISDHVINVSFENIHWINISDSFQGIYIEDINQVVGFSQMMTPSGKERSRNTFLSQNYVPMFEFSLTINASISLSINPYDLGRPVPPSNFIRTSIRSIATSGTIINSSLMIPDLYFHNLQDFLEARLQSRKANTGNNSTLIQFDDLINTVTIYGRLDGANGPDTIIICRVIEYLSNLEKFQIMFYDVTPQNFSYSSSRLTQIKTPKLDIQNVQSNEQDIVLQLQTRSFTEDSYEEMLNRDQSTFKANIIKKYMAFPDFNLHKCFACDYVVESNLIGSHIYRYADIKRDFRDNKLTIEQAAHLIVSGDNGFLLCPTQDKEFEKGMLIFDLNQKIFIANEEKLNANEYEQIKNNIHSSNFSTIELTEEFRSNVREHYKRVHYVPAI